MNWLSRRSQRLSAFRKTRRSRHLLQRRAIRPARSMTSLCPPGSPRLFTTRGTRACTLPTARTSQCAACATKRTRRCNGVTPPPAPRCVFLIRANRSSSSPFPANDFRNSTNQQTMNTKSIATIAAIALLPIAGFAQTPPAPPASPVPPSPPDRHEKMPKVPVTFLGVETSEVPRVVSEQLGLAKGFGLVVDYVVPDGPAAAAGVQKNDILKMLNDQILTEPDQLAKLVRSYSEGTNITLTVLRKGQEQKITVKLTKKEVPQRHEFGPGRHRHEDFPFGDFGMSGDFKEQMENLKEQLGAQKGMIHDAVVKAREEAMRARDQAREQTRRAVEEARRAAGRWNITTSEDGGLKTTKIDIGKAQIVFSDDKGEMKLETVDGKKLLTAKDPQGKLLFSGPVETKEDIDKIPAEVRQRYDKLQEEELRAVAPPSDADEDDDSAGTNDDDNETTPIEQVSTNPFPRIPHNFRTVLD